LGGLQQKLVLEWVMEVVPVLLPVVRKDESRLGEELASKNEQAVLKK
jgi:hypothetical protein